MRVLLEIRTHVLLLTGVVAHLPAQPTTHWLLLLFYVTCAFGFTIKDMIHNNHIHKRGEVALIVEKMIENRLR